MVDCEGFRTYHERYDATYAHNLIRDPLGLSFAFLKVWTTPIKFRSIDLLIKRGLDTKHFFVRRKLIPTGIGSTGAKGQIITVCAKGDGGSRVGSIGLPSHQLMLPPRAGLVTDIGVSLEGYLRL